MFKVTKRVREFLVKNHGLAENATDDAAKSLCLDLVAKGDLDTQKLRELTEKDANESEQRLTAVVEKAVSQAIGSTQPRTYTGGGPTPDAVFGGGMIEGKSGNHIRVKAAGEMYDHTKYVCKHAKTGMPVHDEQGRLVETVSEYERARIGVYFKWLAGRNGIPVVLTEHERGLWAEMLEKDHWVGKVGSEWSNRIDNYYIKALVSDSTSGGLEINPIYFDSAVITKPLLTGELYPSVNIQEVPRGARIEGASIGNPTVVWGTNEPTAQTLFNSDSLVAAIDTTIHTVSCFVEVGRDLMSDSPVAIGQVLEENIGARMSEELDRVIAVGDGVSEPEGIFTASGIGVATTENGNAGAPTVADYEELLFTVGKQYRKSPRCAWIGNDTTYSRARGIAVDSTDQRRVFGMDHESYMLFSRPFKINNNVANTDCAFGDLSRYRMYRRQGFGVEMSKEGDTLLRRNTLLIGVRGRFGGRVMDADAFAAWTNGKS